MSGPHDLFARYTFSHPERAAAELSAVLPPEVVARVDWSSLYLESGSVVDPELKERQSDLLFSARLLGGEPVLIYLLLEHQSSVDRWMALRMLRYVVRQLERWRQHHPEETALPVILPVVMYHGQEGGWTAARRMEDLFNLPDEGTESWLARVPRFEYQVDDLTAEREEALRVRPGPPLVPLALVLLRSGRSEKLAVLLKGWAPLMARVLASPEGQEHLRAAVNYLLKVGAEASDQVLRQVLDSVVGEQRAEELMGTMAEALIKQGVEKGRAEDVLRILAIRGIDVDESARARVLSCRDLNTLDQWVERAMKATSAAELLQPE